MTARRFTGNDMQPAHERAKATAVCSLDEDAIQYVAERGHIQELSRVSHASTLLVGIELGIALADTAHDIREAVERLTGRVEVLDE